MYPEAVIGILLVLAIVLPVIYGQYFSTNPSDLHFNNPFPELKEQIAVKFSDLGLKRKGLVQHLARICHNASTQKAPYKVRFGIHAYLLLPAAICCFLLLLPATCCCCHCLHAARRAIDGKFLSLSLSLQRMTGGVME